MIPVKMFRAGGWLLHNRTHIDTWVRGLKARVAAKPRPLIKPIEEFRDMVDKDQALTVAITAMFWEASLLRQMTPLGTPEVASFGEFLTLLNGIMTEAPEYTYQDDPDDPCGLIGFPINALLDWPMATASGYDVFANSMVNQQFKKIFAHWSKFLLTKESAKVLARDYHGRGKSDQPKVIGWLHPDARREMVKVACCQNPNLKLTTPCQELPFEHFFECDRNDPPYWGYTSWDHFFARKFRFKKGIRPVECADDENVIANACEAAPLQVVHNVRETDTFWVKGQPYSLQNMMNFDPLAKDFVGGTVYQGFLSALSYHRWNSPVTGTIEKAYVVDGTYYLGNRYTGFISPDPDEVAPNDSQPFLSAVATRAVIFIRAKNSKIGLMCVILIGMAEVSSCEITVKQGDPIEKGDQLGMFHFGGSTHCLVFRPEVKNKHNLTFHWPHCPNPEDPDCDKDNPDCNRPGINAWNIPVRSKLATVS